MAPPPRSKRPHQTFVPTDEQRGVVRVLAATRTPTRTIARYIINKETGEGISLNTLKKNFRLELRTGHDDVTAYVVNKLFRLIQNDVPSAIYFYLKTQAGWREQRGGFDPRGLEDDMAGGVGPGAGGAVIDVTPERIPDNPQLAAQIYQQMITG